MEGAWKMVLGRLKANILSALAGSAPPPRQRRHKQSQTRRSAHD
jgi:hypothetical protein